MASLFLLAVLLASRPAAATEGGLRLRLDWRLITQTLSRLRVVEPSSGGSIQGGSRTAAGPYTMERPPRLVVPELLLSVIARNWEGAKRLVGSPTLCTDDLRGTATSRMLVTRVGLAGGLVVPFVQVAFGQWRDPTPVYDPTVGLASQTGAGFEIALRSTTVALEYDWTTLLPGALAERQLGWGQAFVVTRWTFLQ